MLFVHYEPKCCGDLMAITRSDTRKGVIPEEGAPTSPGFRDAAIHLRDGDDEDSSSPDAHTRTGISMVGRVLVAFDGSEIGDRVIDWAVDMADRWQAELHGIYVIEEGWSEGDIARELTIEFEEESAGNVMGSAMQRAKKAGIPMTTYLRRGHPGEEIVACARDIGADLIVVGSVGKSQIERVLVGSVSTFVVTHSPVSVLVVRP
jgi:nucleotide-binding universal stress UspA family protein